MKSNQTSSTRIFGVCKRETGEKSTLRRACALFCVLVGVCSFFILKLWDLAMYDNTPKQVLSGQYTRTSPVTSRTGFVYDRTGRLLSHTPAGGVALVNPAGSRDKNAVAEFLTAYSELSFEDILTKVSSPEPFHVTLSELPEESAPRGVHVYPRYEPAPNSICRHLLGYRDGDGVGKDGIYRRFGALLDASPASLSYRYLADASGGMLHGDAFTVLNNGYTDRSGVVLTIDRELQQLLDDICDRYLDMGAAVLCNLTDFSVAALSSRPLYDGENVAASLDSPRGELINRAFSLYTPGSVFKTVVAAAALETNPELYDFEYVCTGSADVSGKRFHCHELAGHGAQTMREAYANSCNTYFIALAGQIGLGAICETAERLGLGKAQVPGGFYSPPARLPDGTKRYAPAYLANISFGQGDLLMSPIDMTAVYAACTTGVKRPLTLVRGLYRDEEMSYFSDRPPQRVLRENTVDKLNVMMRACVTSGTGWQAQTRSVKTAGKTATAQSGQFKDGEEILHRWFAGVFPADKPEYVLVVICDGNGDNKESPAKIFSEMAEKTAAKKD